LAANALTWTWTGSGGSGSCLLDFAEDATSSEMDDGGCPITSLDNGAETTTGSDVAGPVIGGLFGEFEMRKNDLPLAELE
jgi:hypothetical protein